MIQLKAIYFLNIVWLVGFYWNYLRISITHTFAVLGTRDKDWLWRRDYCWKEWNVISRLCINCAKLAIDAKRVMASAEGTRSTQGASRGFENVAHDIFVSYLCAILSVNCKLLLKHSRRPFKLNYSTDETESNARSKF